MDEDGRTNQDRRVSRRDMEFSSRTVTRIWEEVPAEENPYLAGQCRCHGYDILELAAGRSLVEVIFLLFQGELPTAEQAELLNTLFVAMINPGPRHPASRAAMNAGVGKTRSSHLLPIGLAVLGDGDGGLEVGEAMQFLRKKQKNDPGRTAVELLKEKSPAPEDQHFAPGFGRCFGSVDPMARKIADLLAGKPGSGKFLHWGAGFAEALGPHNLGWLPSGVVAAAFCDLGFPPRAGAGLYQLLCAPGILAHGLELANKPVTAMPFPDEEHYVIKPEK